jgi:ketosteroid isomerase-like protein
MEEFRKIIMQESVNLINRFYSSFQKKDWKGMQECYHPDIVFTDPVFRNLRGPEAKAMWHMLAAASKDLIVDFKEVKSDGARGSCRWEATYSFSRTGRKVHNIIHAEFEFSEGRIIKHTDSFNLWRWSSMALGLTGTFLGWTPLVKSGIRKMALKNLRNFIKEHPEYA